MEMLTSSHTPTHICNNSVFTLVVFSGPDTGCL